MQIFGLMFCSVNLFWNVGCFFTHFWERYKDNIRLRFRFHLIHSHRFSWLDFHLREKPIRLPKQKGCEPSYSFSATNTVKVKWYTWPIKRSQFGRTLRTVKLKTIKNKIHERYMKINKDNTWTPISLKLW